MAQNQSRRHRENLKRTETRAPLPVGEAVKMLRSFSKAKFDETVTVDFKLNIDPRKQDQNLRGAVSLPNGTGKSARVICFAEGDAAKEAREAGAIEVGSADLVKKIEGGWSDFDVAVATPDMMRHVGKLGKILGPQGKMPAPKAGTVTNDVGKTVKEFAAGKIEFRADAGGNVHFVVGKRSFDDAKLAENVSFVMDHVRSLRPSSVKGDYVCRACLSGTMTPGVTLAVEV